MLAHLKSEVKNVWKFVPLRGGGGGCGLMAIAILNFHFVLEPFPKPSYLLILARLCAHETEV